MSQLSVSLPSDGTTADVSDYNTPITAIVNDYNGNIDNSNIASDAAIATSKLADDSGITGLKVADGFVVQMQSASYSAVATGTTQIPNDDTIPQNTEGTEFMTLAITPKSSTNILVIEVTALLSNDAANRWHTGALFQDSTANALAATTQFQTVATAPLTLSITHRMVAGTTSATTFKFRAGSNSTGTLTFNGFSGGRLFGAIPKSSIVITEYKAS